MQVKKNSSNLTEPPDYNCQNSFAVSLIIYLDHKVFFCKNVLLMPILGFVRLS